MIPIIEKLKGKQNLTVEEIHEVMHVIMSGQGQDALVAEFLSALNEKGPTVDEITGAAQLLQEFSLPVQTKHKVVLDTCGTGGDGKNTFNISTLVAFVVAGAGVVVAKHGNRSVSSRCGSADILEAFGIDLQLEQECLGQCLDEIGIAFLFAQRLHPAMKKVAAVRKKMGVKTIFNILGPLINPAGATHQMIGVYNRDLIEPLAHVSKNLGRQRALVVHGHDGLDEITTTGKTYVSEWNGNKIATYDIDPAELNIPYAKMQDLIGGDLQENLHIAQDVLSGESGPQRDIVVLNAAYALYAVGKVQDINDGIMMAKESIDKGQALNKLEALKNFTARS